MKYRLLALLLLGVFSLSGSIGCSSPNNIEKKITLKPSGSNDTTAIQNAVSSLKKGGSLQLAEGTYYIDDTIHIKSKDNIKITGKNTTIIRKDIDTANITAKNCSIFSILKSDSITVSGITLKYDALTSLSGAVVAGDASGGKIYIKPYNSFKPTGKEVYGAINTFDAEGNPDTVFEKYSDTGFEQVLLDNGNICISGLDYNEVLSLKENTPVGLRASMASDAVVNILDSSDIVFEDITVRNSFSGVFFTNGRTFNLTLRRVNISPENEESYFSSNADGLHIAAMGGKLNVEDCNFVKLGDDCVNVHGMAYSVKDLSGTSLTGYNERYKVNVTADWAKEGDEIEFYDKSTLKLLGTAKLKKMSILGGKMTFDKLPDGVMDGTVMANKTMHPSVEISGCTVKSNRARAFLLQTENATVKNCDISGTRFAAVLISPDINYWYEMSPGRNITITGNTISNCGKGAGAAIVTDACHDMNGNYPADVNKNLTVEGNTFNNCPSAIKATSLSGLKFKDNILNNVGESGIFYAVRTVRCDNVEVGSNVLNDCSVELYNE